MKSLNRRLPCQTLAIVTLFCTVAATPLPVRAKDNADLGLRAARQLQQAFARVAEKASPAVVVITNKQKRRVGPRESLRDQLPPEFRFFFGIPESPDGDNDRETPRQRPPQAVGRGSGIIVRPNGYIVTNYHVIKGHDALEVKLHDGTVYASDNEAEKSVEVVGVDKDTDLAVLRIGGDEVGDLPVLSFADSEKVEVGQWAIAVGAPFNFDYSVTVGVISQKGRYDVRMNTYENYLQTDASINPGNSGGPLLNLDGRMVGVNDFIVTGGGFSRGNVGVGFAIASNLVKQVVDDIIASGSVQRPWLGIVMQQLTPELRSQFNADRGVVISDVLDGDPADKAGLKAGDIILKVGDRTVDTPHDVQFAVLRYQPGDEIPLEIIRDGREKTVAVVARQKDDSGSVAATAEDLFDDLGLDLEKQKDDVVVTNVVPGSAADASGLRPGDIIHDVNQQAVRSVKDALEALRDTRNGVALLYVERDGGKFFVTLNVEEE